MLSAISCRPRRSYKTAEDTISDSLITRVNNSLILKDLVDLKSRKRLSRDSKERKYIKAVNRCVDQCCKLNLN